MGLPALIQCLNARAKDLIAHPPKLVYVFLLIVFLELEESVQKAPTIRLLENAICSQYYHHKPNIGDVKESMCKTSPIQSRLAHIRGALSLFDAVPVILLGSFYGSLADRKGRRGPFALAVFGIICQMACIYVVCSTNHPRLKVLDLISRVGHMWNRLPIEVVWVSSVFRLIGGGPNLAYALCLTMASDLSTDDTRSKSFYRVFTASLVIDMISPTIAFTTLRHSLWLPYLVCAISLLCTYPVLLWMPETRSYKKESNSLEETPIERTGLSAYIEFLRDWRIAIAVITVFLVQFRQNTLEILLPYVSVRFNMELGKTATLLSVVSAVNIVVFLVFLPLVTDYLQEKKHIASHRVNVWVARTSSATLAIGAAVLAAAPNVGLVVLALIIYATGFGVRLSILAVVTAFVRGEQETGRLYTMVATTDAIAHMIASPLLQWVWGYALTIGGRWIVLPFLVLMCIFILAFGCSCFLQEPEVSISDDDLRAEREALLVGEERESGVEESLAYTG